VEAGGEAESCRDVADESQTDCCAATHLSSRVPTRSSSSGSPMFHDAFFPNGGVLVQRHCRPRLPRYLVGMTNIKF
jgi:hypothetical protein